MTEAGPGLAAAGVTAGVRRERPPAVLRAAEAETVEYLSSCGRAEVEWGVAPVVWRGTLREAPRGPVLSDRIGGGERVRGASI